MSDARTVSPRHISSKCFKEIEVKALEIPQMEGNLFSLLLSIAGEAILESKLKGL